MKKVIAATLVALFALTGCSQPNVAEIGATTETAVLALPGVTGGTLELYYASLTPNLICDLTGSGTTKAELVATMDAVARTIVTNLEPLDSSSMVSCVIENGDVSANLSDLLGFEARSLDDLRRNLR